MRPEWSDIAIVLAAVAALGYGSGDFLGGAATRKIPVMRTLLWAHGIGLVLAVAWVILYGGEPLADDLLEGAVSGVFGLGGLFFLYTGLARGRAAVVAPTAAVVGAVVPVVTGVMAGELLGWWRWLGVGAALPAILLVSRASGITRRAGGLVYGLAAGVFFGGYFVALAGTTHASGLWPLVASRALSTVLLTVGAAIVGRSWFKAPAGGTAAAVAGVGVLDMVGNVGYLLASRVGSLTVVAVVASLYPAVTVTISRFANDERLGTHQMVGLALAVAAVALLSIA